MILGGYGKIFFVDVRDAKNFFFGFTVVDTPTPERLAPFH